MYHPELYDIVTPASFRGDAEWYVAKARDAGGPVLELGAGTGRITLQIAQAGCRIHALDADPPMLDRLQQKLMSLPLHVRDLVSVTAGDMRSFAATRSDTVRQQLQSEHRFEEFGHDGTLQRTSLHRLSLAYLYPPDIRRLLKEAGFVSVRIGGAFDGRPFENDTDELVIEAATV